MKKAEFENLSLQEKGQVTFSEGKFIASKEYYNQRLVLYDFGEFFAEVWYFPEENKIHKIESIDDNPNKIYYFNLVNNE